MHHIALDIVIINARRNLLSSTQRTKKQSGDQSYNNILFLRGPSKAARRRRHVQAGIGPMCKVDSCTGRSRIKIILALAVVAQTVGRPNVSTRPDHRLRSILRAMADITLSVVIPCYDRLDLLERTLRAAVAQIVPEGIGWEVIVADNHPQTLARALVEGIAANAAVPVIHVAALPARNISSARNAGVNAARGSFVAFSDDDEAPLPNWLAEHHACLLRTGADASFGPKYPEFEGGKPPSWDPNGYYYTVDFKLPADTELRPLDWWPPQGRGLGTGNSMMRKATCLPGPAPFDEVFGRTGGEDSMLLFNLSKSGRRFVWCPAAVVIEYNQLGRLAVDYMRQRLRRSAQHSAECRAAVADHKMLARAAITAVGLAQLGVHGVLWMLSSKADEVKRTKHWLGIAKGIGKLRKGKPLNFVPERREAATAPAEN